MIGNGQVYPQQPHVRYTMHGRVVVGCRRREGEIRTEIWDTGPGIPDAQQEKVFQEYFQLENLERDRAKGLGLGLAIVRRLTDLLDGELTLRSQRGRGSCFSVAIRGRDHCALTMADVEDVNAH